MRTANIVGEDRSTESVMGVIGLVDDFVFSIKFGNALRFSLRIRIGIQQYTEDEMSIDLPQQGRKSLHA
jgi:hypothetical protein